MFVSLGGDPGSSHPGLAVTQWTGLKWHILRLPVLHSLDDLADELSEIHHAGLHIDVVCYESVAWSLHAKAQGYGSGQILDAVGQLRLFAKVHRIPFIGVTGATWRKNATGSVHASKEDVRTALQRRVHGWPKGLIGLNRSDAVAISLCGGMTPTQARLLAMKQEAKKALRKGTKAMDGAPPGGRAPPRLK